MVCWGGRYLIHTAGMASSKSLQHTVRKIAYCGLDFYQLQPYTSHTNTLSLTSKCATFFRQVGNLTNLLVGLHLAREGETWTTVDLTSVFEVLWISAPCSFTSMSHWHVFTTEHLWSVFGRLLYLQHRGGSDHGNVCKLPPAGFA